MLILVEILKFNINMHSQIRKMIIITLTIAFLPIIINSFSPVITPTSRILSPSSSQIQKHSSQQLNMVASARQLKLSSKIKKSNTKKQKPLTIKEERELLKLAKEYRRLQQIESDISSFDEKLIINKAVKVAGYVNDLEYQNAYIKGKEARETLITRNIGLVQYVITTILASRFKSQLQLRSLLREDLIQEGCIGLSKAIDKFDYTTYENKFATYATWWVKSSISRSITEYDDLVRVPENVLQDIQKIKSAALRIGIDWDNIVSQQQKLIPMNNDNVAVLEKMVAKEAGLTLLQVQKAIRAFQVKRRVASELEPWMIPSSSSATNNNDSCDDNSKVIKNALSTFLKPKEMQALSLRYGLMQPSESNIPTNIGPVTVATTHNKRTMRDYLAEAENDIFGKNGIIQSSNSKQTKVKSKRRTKQEQQNNSSMIKSSKVGEAMTFSEIGKQMTISTEYSRRLCLNALNKLQRAVEDGKLRELQPLLYSL